MEVALLSHQSVVVAPWLYPSHKISEPIEAKALGPPEMFLYVRHVIHWAPFLDAQCLLLVQEEVCEEFISQLYRLCLPKGGGVILVVDPEHMLKVPYSPRAMVFGGQSCGGEITLLTRRLPTCLFLYSPGRLATVSLLSSHLSPAVLGALTTHGGSFINWGVKGDSPPSRFAWQLYCLLVQSPWPARWWLTERRCHLRSAQCHGWCWSLLGQSPWTLHHLCLSVPFYSGPNLYGPPNVR